MRWCCEEKRTYESRSCKDIIQANTKSRYEECDMNANLRVKLAYE